MSARPRVRPAPARGRLAVAAAVGALLLVVATGCAATPAPETPAPAQTSPGAALWPAGAGFDYQLGGASPVPEGVTVVARDSTDEPAKAGFDICYVNGFQTQPGVEWPDGWLLHRSDGELLVDPGWPDEHLFDTANPSTRQAVAERLGTTIDGCAAAGYDAVEFDNLDSYSRSDGALSLDDAVAFARLLVARAHAAGLVAGQKNTGELEVRGRDEIGYDFAVTEECDRFDECPGFTEVYGSNVLDIEYTDDLRGSFADVCAREGTPASTILRDRDLAPAGRDGHVYERCGA
ncbi:endo alpha-1,4 polygalactosaminidase [Frigoribacterium sp. 2-23]|uniref:endo alpha-1,4 polygalactosaminidase n=1 Tax=Frigoribacterium sp. 2-23 TaxID=3415006 RepID=UPI003C6FB5EE